MKRILVTGAGGSPAVNFIRSLRVCPEKLYIVGTDADKYFLVRAEVDKRYLVPSASSSNFIPILNKIIEKEKIDFIHIQNDFEVGVISKNSHKIKAKLFLPNPETVRVCQNKFLSYQRWESAGIKVPKTMIINSQKELQQAFKEYNGMIWIRDITGAGGRGSFPVNNFERAKFWLDFQDGWGRYTASELLQSQSVTWMSIWNNGKLIVAQSRKRLYWELSKISPSGISGVTGAAVTVSDPSVDKIAQKAILAIDKKPHGLFGVDLTYDKDNIPNPTEINIGRFFTTILFFAEAGLNMPYIFIKLAFGEKLPKISKKMNPLKPGLVWIRGVDFKPILTTEKEVEQYTNKHENRS